MGRCTYIRYMRQLRKCSCVITATFLDRDKVQKTGLKPLQLVKNEWSPPLQQLPVLSVSTKCLRIDSTKYSCVQFDVQFSTSVVNKLHCTFAWICVDFSFSSFHKLSCNECKNSCFEVLLFVVWLNWVLRKFDAFKSWVMIGLWWLSREDMAWSPY